MSLLGFFLSCTPLLKNGVLGEISARLYYWRDVRVVEGARLESVYTPKGYRGFESHSLRKRVNTLNN
jgi:hypothetical protein